MPQAAHFDVHGARDSLPADLMYFNSSPPRIVTKKKKIVVPQVAHFDVHGARDSLPADLMYFNSFLPQDVKVLDLSYAPPGG